jgi:glutathione synthase/RimK-type ligase-like ATP-grasp enzyme
MGFKLRIMNKKFDVVILTDRRYTNPIEIDQYVQNVLDEDNHVKRALENQGLKITRLAWSDPDFDWETTKYILFRSTWDYFDRFDAFSQWLKIVSGKTKLLNSEKLIRWNIDKHYLNDLKQNGINIIPTLFIEKKTKTTLEIIHKEAEWNQTILKPCISGAARHTYQLSPDNLKDHEAIFQELISKESMMLQPFQNSIVEKGEISLMIINGKYTHAVLKKAKKGDFRVQDDYGGSVHIYTPTSKEIIFAEKAIKVSVEFPIYARVDIVTDNNGQLAIAELELIEPELWFRNNPEAAGYLAEGIRNLLQ